MFTSATEKLSGKIDYRHVYINFTNIEVELDGNNKVRTCPAALGPGFAAGTTDGPGVFGFQQGDTEVRNLPYLIFHYLKIVRKYVRFCSLISSDQRAVEKVERRIEKAKPISGGLPKA